jgi:hypothetical protein
MIVSDNGSEFTSNAILQWEPGQNAFIEASWAAARGTLE